MSDRKPVKLDKPQFCKGCGLEVYDDITLEWHKDLHGFTNVIPLDEVNFVESKPKDTDLDDLKKVYDFAESKIKKIVINQNNSEEVFRIITLNGHVEALDLSSQRAIDWLNYEFTKSIDSTKLHSQDFYKTVLGSLIAKARFVNPKKVKIFNRIAQFDNEIWYDLAREDGKCVKITAKGVFGVVIDIDSPIFRQNQSLQEQIPPRDYDKSKKALDEFIELIKIEPKDKLIFKVHLVSLFLEGYPMPIIAIGGASGSFKTTINAFIKKIVDPSGIDNGDNVNDFPENLDDLKIYLNNRYLGSFDNVSYISKQQSDIFCRAITGNSNIKRKLYTNSEETILSFRRKIILNGIVPNLDYEDLQSRLIYYDRESPDPKNRMTEKILIKKFDELFPFVLGEIFHILSESMSRYKSLKDSIKPKERMADFEVWGEIISRCIGNADNDFLTAYTEKIHATISLSRDSFPIITVLENFMKDRDEYEGTASDLYSKLVGLAKALEIETSGQYVKFPRHSNKLVKALKESDFILRNIGLIFHNYTWTKTDPKFTKGNTIIRIRKKIIQQTLEKVYSPSSLPSPEEKQARNQGKSGEDNGEDTISILTEASEDTSENSEDPKTESSPKIDDSSHENSASEDSECSEDTS